MSPAGTSVSAPIYRYRAYMTAWLDMIAPAAEDPRYEKLDLITRLVDRSRRR